MLAAGWDKRRRKYISEADKWPKNQAIGCPGQSLKLSAIRFFGPSVKQLNDSTIKQNNFRQLSEHIYNVWETCLSGGQTAATWG
jgi:hypothetical protein